ncbi:uncharacterized protein SPSK_01274 [Sporothrix schenckii 1099-18]|uniref:Uncharacterized protein n=1 Tax=Sporothrix schenckii 1099-18 TaxID=1397361 RepID=A0A0F2LY47_SPOSC|nr:uncharacterized protein SPSK_01274 [Sporothrix schenckii 1099-18]KJR81410.1 hypothetical protein SPSK_01274 [Sporothrix schenckii 1099-18]
MANAFMVDDSPLAGARRWVRPRRVATRTEANRDEQASNGRVEVWSVWYLRVAADARFCFKENGNLVSEIVRREFCRPQFALLVVRVQGQSERSQSTLRNARGKWANRQTRRKSTARNASYEDRMGNLYGNHKERVGAEHAGTLSSRRRTKYVDQVPKVRFRFRLMLLVQRRINKWRLPGHDFLFTM